MTSFIKVIHLPLIDCPKADMKLRFEISQIMEEFNINYEDLIYTEDIAGLYESNHSINLYDHNYRKQLATKGIH